MSPVLRLLVLLLGPLLAAQSPGTKPPVPDKFSERRAELLRSMSELRAKLQALETELQILEEERQAAAANSPAPAPGADWRSGASPASPAAASAPSRTGAEPAYQKPARGRCQAVTTQGKRCSRSAEPGSKFCWQHRH